MIEKNKTLTCDRFMGLPSKAQIKITSARPHRRRRRGWILCKFRASSCPLWLSALNVCVSFKKTHQQQRRVREAGKTPKKQKKKHRCNLVALPPVFTSHPCEIGGSVSLRAKIILFCACKYRLYYIWRVRVGRCSRKSPVKQVSSLPSCGASASH